MALMTDERRKEMEEEMNRFENELALQVNEDSSEVTIVGIKPPCPQKLLQNVSHRRRISRFEQEIAPPDDEDSPDVIIIGSKQTGKQEHLRNFTYRRRFELEIALPGDEDSPEVVMVGSKPPREHEVSRNVSRRKPQLPSLDPAVIAALPDVLKKGPPPPPPPPSPPIPPLCAPPPPPMLNVRSHPEPRFIPHQVNRQPQRPQQQMRPPNFMGMRGGPGPMHSGHFPHPDSMGHHFAPHQGNQGPYGPPHGNHQGPMMSGPHMMNPMHHMPPQQHHMGPMPPSFHPPPPGSNEPPHHFMPRAMQNQFTPQQGPPSSESPSPTVVASAPAVYAAPFMKSHEEHIAISESSTIAIGQAQSFPVMTTPIFQKVEKSAIARVPEEVVSLPVPTVAVPEEVIVSKKKEKKKKVVRMAGGQAWEDNSLQEWDPDDFRIFCGDLGNDVTDEVLIRAFSKYTSFVKAKVIRDKRTNKTKGYGFVSFKDPQDFIKAMREMNGRYVGSRPIKLRKSTWRERNIDIVKRKQKEKEKLGLL